MSFEKGRSYGAWATFYFFGYHKVMPTALMNKIFHGHVKPRPFLF